MAKYGKHRYVGDEGTNIVLGQLGFVVLGSDESTPEGEYSAIKAVGAEIAVTATSFVGDDLTALPLADGDIIYGAFSDVTAGTIAGNDKLLVYSG